MAEAGERNRTCILATALWMKGSTRRVAAGGSVLERPKDPTYDWPVATAVSPSTYNTWCERHEQAPRGRDLDVAHLVRVMIRVLETPVDFYRSPRPTHHVRRFALCAVTALDPDNIPLELFCSKSARWAT